MYHCIGWWSYVLLMAALLLCLMLLIVTLYYRTLPGIVFDTSLMIILSQLLSVRTDGFLE